MAATGLDKGDAKSIAASGAGSLQEPSAQISERLQQHTEQDTVVLGLWVVDESDSAISPHAPNRSEIYVQATLRRIARKCCMLRCSYLLQACDRQQLSEHAMWAQGTKEPGDTWPCLGPLTLLGCGRL